MANFYTLDGHTPVPCDDPVAWAEWREAHQRHVALTLWVVDGQEVARVSTVFLGLDHGWFGGPPVLFETMMFGEIPDTLEDYQKRCSTWEEAEHMHIEAINQLEAAIGPSGIADPHGMLELDHG